MTEQIEQAIKDNDVRLIRAVYAGPEGIVRGKAFTPRGLQEVLQGGIGLTQAQASVFVLDQLPVESEFQPVGEVRICPDPDTFQLLPYLPGHARMLSDLRTLDGNAWELCPRALLKQAMQLLEDRGWSIEAAFENEWVEVSPSAPAPPSPGAPASSPACRGSGC